MRPDGPGAGAVLVRAVNWLGDAVMTTPALAAVRTACPRARLVVAANETVAELFRGHPDVDDVLVYERRGRHAGVAGTFRMARLLRRQRFSRAILFQNAFDAAALTFLAGIPERAGYARDGRGWLLTRAVPVTAETLALHHVEYYLRLVSALGMPPGGPPVLRLAVAPQEAAAMRTRLASLGVPEGRPILGINPGAAYGSSKRWYPDRFAAVADALAEEWGAAVAIMGSGPEAPIAADIEAAMRVRPANLAGRTTVRELLALISLCSFLVTNDSGPMHVAAALGVPLAAIFGPTDWRTTSPWTPRARIVRAGVDCAPCRLRECDRGHECMLAVTPAMVIDAARGLAAEVRHAGA